MKLFNYLLICSLAALYSLPQIASANEQLERDLVARITKSKGELDTNEKRISTERARIAVKLDEKQEQLKKLRKDAAALQRVVDEQLLGLDQLKTRVDQWTTQNNYQHYLLTSYVESTNLPVKKTDSDIKLDAAIVALALEQIERTLIPRWQQQTAITPTGSIAKVMMLTNGPVEVAYDAIAGTGGMLTRQSSGELQISPVFTQADLKELESLQTSGNGYLRFDPTLGNALQLMEGEETVLAHINKGGVWALPIIFFGLLSLIIAMLKSWQFVRLPAVNSELTDQLNELLTEYRNEKDPAIAMELKQKIKSAARDAGPAQRKLIEIALSSPVSQQRDDLFVAYLMEYKHKLERYMGVVATSASVAPLLGLLGTVSGMISTFKMMTIFGSGDAATVSGGISEALITTELGLIVAIPSLVVSALLTRKARSYYHKLENFAIKLSKMNFSK